MQRFLSAAPILLRGMSRILYFRVPYADRAAEERPAVADMRALRADWEVVGNDLRAAIAHVEHGPRVSLVKASR